jgi:uncharacterized protein with HEPN domain
MSRDDPLVRLLHMRDYAREALAFVEGKTREDLASDRLLYHGVIRTLELIGEAATHLPAELRERYPAVPWSRVIALRNRLIHGYEAVDTTLLWEVLSRNLPELCRDLERMCSDLEAES